LGAPSGSRFAHDNGDEAYERSGDRRSSRSSRGGSRGARSSGSKGLMSKARVRLLITLVVTIAACGGAIALYFSGFLPITQVTVVGNSKLLSGHVISLAAVPEDSTFFRTDTEAIRQRLLTEPWISDVSVERGFPDTVMLRITEQPIAAVVSIVPETAYDAVQQWVISKDGAWIAEVDKDVVGSARISPEELVKLPKIKDVSAAVRPVSGLTETDEGIANALTLLREFSPEMRGMVAAISAPDAIKTSLTLYNNVRVAFGAAENIEAKELAIASLLEEYAGTITYINVRMPDRTSHRATDQKPDTE